MLPKRLLFALAFAANVTPAFAQLTDVAKDAILNGKYVLGPDAQPQPGVPQGKLVDLKLGESRTYSGYTHKASVYIPPGYDGSAPVAVMIFQDGSSFASRDGSWRVPTVLDNLIFKRELPKIAAVFVDPGVAVRREEEQGQERSYEYDTVSGTYPEFLLTEVLPAAAKVVRITANPEGRGVAGSSSGGIASFNAAWQRPNSFHKVFSAIGSFVNIRGGGAYPDIVKASLKKPIRVYLQDGANDGLGGQFVGLNWPEGNRAMAAALAFKGYDYQLVMGEGTHSPAHGAALFPSAMRWLWRDYHD